MAQEQGNKNDAANSRWERKLGVVLRTATINGIRMRWADTAVLPGDDARPIVLFMHGE